MSSPHGQTRNDFAVRPRNVPELAHRHIGARLLHESRQQREVVVLHEHHRAILANFLDHRIGEAAVDAHVLLPVGLVEFRTRIRDVTQRPQRAVGAAVVIALLFFGCQPQPLQRVRRSIGRHAHAPVLIGGLAIGAAAAMRDPGAAARAHHRIERGDQAAGRPRPLDAFGFLPAAQPVPQPARRAPAANVDVRLAVRDHDQPRASQGFGDRRAELGRGHDARASIPAVASQLKSRSTSAMPSTLCVAEVGRRPTSTPMPHSIARKASSSVMSSPT